MQLPRGTFREIKKLVLISSILDELEHTKFSGICNISSDTASGTLVFKSGNCILAKILNKSGDGAWEELQKIGDHEVDAALSSLDEAQVQLSLEFNKPCRILKAVHPAPATPAKPVAAPLKTTAAPHKPANVASPALRPSSSFTAAPAPSKPVVTPSLTRTGSQPLPVKPASPPPAQPLSARKPGAPEYTTPQIPVRHQQEQKKPAPAEEPPQDPSSFDNDIDTFDTLDLDNVTDKIRNDCKTMIKQLQLEHLMER